MRSFLSLAQRTRPTIHPHCRKRPGRTFLTSILRRRQENRRLRLPTIIVAGGVLLWLLSAANHEIQKHPPKSRRKRRPPEVPPENEGEEHTTAWSTFISTFEGFSNAADIEWIALSEKVVGLILPEWSKHFPMYLRKLQQDLSNAPGSLAEEIWRESRDPAINPEVRWAAKVRVSNSLCREEMDFLARRKHVAKIALAKYLGLDEKDIHPDDVPTIAMCGSGGGLRALVAGTGSLLAAEQDGLLDCVTYTAGVSGFCWLQAINNSSIGKCSIRRVLDHLKGRINIHLTYPISALETLISAPTDKYLLRGFVEKLRGDEGADFGLVDVYGLLLAARLLVPVGDLGVNDRDLKISNQKDYVKFGQNPLPIYTAVRHEIPEAALETAVVQHSPPEDAKLRAKQEAWFQWFEVTPYEFFCEEFAAGIPTWAMGRKFDGGYDVARPDGLHQPEIRLPLLMGVFGSAFCATLSHYYQEIRPVFKNITGFGAIDEMITGRNRDLSKVHPIDPATVPNFAYGMEGLLPKTTPESIYKNQYLQLMDAGMSNNLPIYPLLRPGRDVDVIIAFDNSADIKQDNWLAVTDGYARQRGVKGWPIGVGWPTEEDTLDKVQRDLKEATAATTAEAARKLKAAVSHDTPSYEDSQIDLPSEGPSRKTQGKIATDLGYCTIWVGSTEERRTTPPPPSKAIDSLDADWSLLSSPTAGIAVIYLPLLANSRVPGVNPGSTDFLSTWNMVYKPNQVDQVAELAKANYDEGKSQIKKCVRAVYERKKLARERREELEGERSYWRMVRRGLTHKLGEGDHFS